MIAFTGVLDALFGGLLHQDGRTSGDADDERDPAAVRQKLHLLESDHLRHTQRSGKS